MTDKAPEIVTSSAEPTEELSKPDVASAAQAKDTLAPAETEKKRSVSPAAPTTNGDSQEKSQKSTSPARASPKGASPPKASSPAGGAAESTDGGETAKTESDVKTAKTEVPAVNGEAPAGASVSGSDVPAEGQSDEAMETDEGEKAAESKKGAPARGRGRGRGRGGRGGRGAAAAKPPAAPRAEKTEKPAEEGETQEPKEPKQKKERAPAKRDTTAAAKEAEEIVGSDVNAMPRLRSASRKQAEPAKPAAVDNGKKRTAQDAGASKKPAAKRGRK